MALYKRAETYWTDFMLQDGRRFRLSLGTTDRREATQRERDKVAEAKDGKIVPRVEPLAKMTLEKAVDAYMEKVRNGSRRVASKQRILAENSITSERDRLRRVVKLLGDRPVRKITAEEIDAYMAKRKDAGISPRTIGMELSALRRVLKEARVWKRLQDVIELPTQEASSIGRALTEEEKNRLLQTAATKPEWAVARLAMTLSLNTTMRGCEIKGLRWQDIDFLERTLTVRRSKTAKGLRPLPLNEAAWDSMLELRKRGKTLFGDSLSPDWYVFPHAEGFQPPDPTKPMKGWRSAWRRLTKAAGLQGFRFHDCRHQAITELSENGEADMTILALAGHVSRRMIEYYSHIRQQAKRNALDKLCKGLSPRGVMSQTHVTIEAKPIPALPQVIEKEGMGLVDLVGFEPTTS
jgi:integrase